MSNTPVIYLVHALPGRLRLRFAEPLADVEVLTRRVREHDGIEEIDYTLLTRSLLICFAPGTIEQSEVVLRVALALSLAADHAPVRVVIPRPHEEISAGALLALLTVLGAFAFRGFGVSKPSPRLLEALAGGATGLAVAHHGWQEYRTRGSFDPEVLSLGYLLTSFRRGEMLAPSLVTWLITFGRHLFEAAPAGIRVNPLGQPDAEGKPRYEIVVDRDLDPSSSGRAFYLLRSLLKAASMGSALPGLLEDIRRVASAHEEILEGMDSFPDGISLRFGS